MNLKGGSLRVQDQCIPLKTFYNFNPELKNYQCKSLDYKLLIVNAMIKKEDTMNKYKL